MIVRLAELNSKIESERENHRQEAQRRDEQIVKLKQEMAHNMELSRHEREKFNAEIEAKKQEMSNQLLLLEDKAKIEKQALADALTIQNKLFSEKKTTLVREQALLLQTLKRQEDQLSFDIQPLKNQIMDLQNRLEQERASRDKIIRSKEEAIQNLKLQKDTLSETLANEQKQSEMSLEHERTQFLQKIEQAKKKWDDEKNSMQETLAQLQKESADLGKQISQVPAQAEEQKRIQSERIVREKDQIQNIYEPLSKQYDKEREQFENLIKNYDQKRSQTEQLLKNLQERLKTVQDEHHQKLILERDQWEKEIDRIQTTIDQGKQQCESDLEFWKKSLETLQSDLDQQRAVYEKSSHELEMRWKVEKEDWEKKIDVLQKEYEGQKLIWHNSLLERTTKIQGLEQQIELSRQQGLAEQAEYIAKKKVVEDESQSVIENLEAQKKGAQDEADQKIGLKKKELDELKAELHVFLQQSHEAQQNKSAEISQMRDELQAKLLSTQQALEQEKQNWVQQLNQKDSEINFYKNELASKETDFKFKWAQDEKEFEDFKISMAAQIEDLQRSIFKEHHQLDMKLNELQSQIAEVQEQRAKETFSAQQMSIQLEEEFSRTKKLLETEIGELESNLQQEKITADQQSKVKESEIISLKNTLEQKKTQRQTSLEARQRVMEQERNRLKDLIYGLHVRLEKEKTSAEKALQPKTMELELLQEKIRTQKEKNSSEQAQRQKDTLEAKTAMELRVKELTKLLDDQTQLHMGTIGSKQQELEQLTNKLEAWNDLAAREDEQEGLKWDQERESIEAEIRELETRFNNEKMDWDQRLLKKSQETALLNQDLTRLRSEHEEQINNFKTRKAEIEAEREKWETKAKEECARLIQDLRVVNHDVERLKVQVTLKETQLSIAKQKKERELRWSRRPLETQLTDLKMKWEEKEKDYKKKLELQDNDAARISKDIAHMEDLIREEIRERDKTLQQLKGEIDLKIQQLQNGSEDGENLHQVFQDKQNMADQLRETLKKDEDDLKALENHPSLEILEGLKEEIGYWKKKLDESTDEQSMHTQEGQVKLFNLQKSFEEAKKKLYAEELKSEEIIAEVKKQKLVQPEGKINQKSDRAAQQSSEARIYMESGISAFAAENYNEAVFYFTQAIHLDPETAVAYQMIGLVYQKQGNLSAAMESLERAAELDPQNEFLKKHINDMKNKNKNNPNAIE